MSVTYDDGETETYQLPRRSTTSGRSTCPTRSSARSATPTGWSATSTTRLHDKAATVHWFQGIAAERTAPGLAFHGDLTLDGLPPGGPSIVVGAEQSNTSVIFGDTVI